MKKSQRIAKRRLTRFDQRFKRRYKQGLNPSQTAGFTKRTLKRRYPREMQF